MSASEQMEPVAVELPCGFLKESTLHKEAAIIPMTGKVRKMIARPEIRQSPAKVIDTLLTQCVTTVGPMSRVTRAVTDRLFLGDRDYLVMKIREISLGKLVQSHIQCDACGEKMTVSIDLSTEVPVKKLSDVETEQEGDEVVFDLIDESLNVHGKFRLPRGSDQHIVAPMYRKNPVAANYALYQNCLLEWNEKPITQLDPDFFDCLPLPVIDFIDEEFMERQPGPDMRVPVDCFSCGNEMTMALESSDFLFRLPKKGRT